MSTIWEPYKACIFFTFSAQENFRDWIFAVIFRAKNTNAFVVLFAHQSLTNNTRATWCSFLARFVASRSDTDLVTSLGALVMLTFPRAFFFAGNAWLATYLIALAVFTAIFTFPGAGWASLTTGLFANMGTN